MSAKVTDKWPRGMTDLELKDYERSLKRAKRRKGPVQFSYINWDNGYMAAFSNSNRAERTQGRKS